MKLMIINPDYGISAEGIKMRCDVLQQYAGPDVKVSMQCLTDSQVYIDSSLDVVLAGPEIVTKAVVAEANGYDAVILYCFSDPAIDACREAVSIPVIGAGQAACLFAPVLGRQIGLLLADSHRIAEKKLFIQQTGIDYERVCSIRGGEFRGKSIWENREEALQALTMAGRAMIEEEGVQLLILGCLSFLGMAGQLSAALHIPVIDPAVAAVSMAESLVRQRLATSRLSYPAPPKRERVWGSGKLLLT